MATYSLSALRTFVATHQSAPFWIGVDVHKRSYHVALLRADHTTCTSTTTGSPDAFIAQLRRLDIPVAGVAYEAGPTGFGLARALLRPRHQLVDRVCQCKQRIKGFLLYHGFKETDAIRTWRSDWEEQIAAMPLLPEGRLTMESHVRELRFLKQELSDVADQLESLNQQPEHRPVIQSLTSVPGVGKVVATSFHLELFRPERFQRGEEVASYLGLAPTVRHSGEKHPGATWSRWDRNGCDPS